MRLSALPLLSCPGRIGGRRCRGALETHSEGRLRLLGAPQEPDELLEGLLRCRACGTQYPLLSGVAMVVPRPEEYLRRYYPSIRRDLKRHGRLTDAASAWLNGFGGQAATEDYGADFRFSQQFEDPWAVAVAMAGDPDALYGGFAEWLRSIQGRNPYDVLAGWARDLIPQRHLALDAGCGGGGLVSRLAPLFGMTFGADLSFLSILLARRAVLHRPAPERTYFLTVRRGQEMERPLPLTRVEHAEFVVGDVCALPFVDGLFDAVCSSNVIDIAGLEPPLDEAARALRSGGTLLLSDPYYFRDGEAPAGDPRSVVRSYLDRRGFRIAAERDGVPWAWATYDRHWRLYFNDCLAARKA